MKTLLTMLATYASITSQEALERFSGLIETHKKIGNITEKEYDKLKLRAEEVYRSKMVNENMNLENHIDLERFGTRLGFVREVAGITARRLGKIIGLSASTIIRYEKSMYKPKLVTVRALADYFNVNPEWLIGKDVNMSLDGKIPEFKSVPILDKFLVDVPIENQTEITGYESSLTTIDVDFCFKVDNDSFMGESILKGDLAYIHLQPDVENGKIAALIIDHNIVLRRIFRTDKYIILKSESPFYPDQVYSKMKFKTIKIIGKVIASKRYFI